MNKNLTLLASQENYIKLLLVICLKYSVKNDQCFLLVLCFNMRSFLSTSPKNVSTVIQCLHCKFTYFAGFSSREFPFVALIQLAI